MWENTATVTVIRSKTGEYNESVVKNRVEFSNPAERIR
jgi:hypothetical protein